MRPSFLAAPALALTLAACSSNGLVCSETTRKQGVLDAAHSYYLYQDLLPDLDVQDFGSAEELLQALTADARAAGVDRGWSFLMSTEDANRQLSEGRSIGYGIGYLTTGEAPALRVFVKQVIQDSPAAGASFLRGDEILAAGPSASELTAVSNLDAAGVSALLSSGGVTGTEKVLRVVPAGGAEVVRTMTSAEYDLHPVASHRVFEGTHTGYVQLRTFVPAAHDDLRAAFAEFKEQGVQNVVVDLRYNGGGSLDTAVVLADLLGKGLVGQKMFDLTANAHHPELDQTFEFDTEADGGTFQRVAFITTDGSASASELVPNALDAYPDVEVAFVGGKTYGKPVGQYGLELRGCDTVLFLISFSLQNAEGHGGYYQGLPDAQSHAPLCPAADDLEHAQDSADEASTAAAVYFAENGACPPAPAPAPALRARAAAPRVDQLNGVGRTMSEREMPGTF